MRYTTIDTENSPGFLASSEVEASASDVLLHAAAAFGLSTATLFVMPSKTDRLLKDLVLETSLDPEFWQRMDELCFLPTCALFNAVRSSILPVQWSADNLRRQSLVMNMAEPPVLALYNQYQLSHGIVFPVTSIDGMRHAIRFDGDRAPLSQSEINDLAMQALHFFQNYDGARHPLHDPCGLTERELEVVRWSSTGKTSAEIATVMSLSDHTVNAYMNNALRKLNCANRTQLVAKALRMRIIS